MAETSIHKVNSASSPEGKMGQKYLACGVTLGMRLWENVPIGKDYSPAEGDYESAGYEEDHSVGWSRVETHRMRSGGEGSMGFAERLKKIKPRVVPPAVPTNLPSPSFPKRGIGSLITQILKPFTELCFL
jgi:hypothetical protein